MRKEQAIRGKVKPQPYQVRTMQPITRREIEASAPRESFWMTAPREGFTSQAEAIFGERYRTVVVKKQKLEASRPAEKVCERSECGKKFVPSLRAPGQQYCSKFCGKKAWKQRQAA
jgi:hypothetical protein